ncbi:MAG: flagellar biosynthetic protein FliR [Burkholderiaceae bacterium]
MISFTDQQLTGLMLGVLLPLFRLLGLFTSAPVLSQRSTPMRVRVALAAAIALIVVPGIEQPALTADVRLLPLIAHEVVIGLLIGFVARVIFSAFEVAGEAIGLQMGLSFAGFFDPQSGASNPVSRMLNLIALTGFVTLNGHVLLISAIINSFNLIPVTGGWQWLSPDLLRETGLAMFALSLNIALPFILLILLLNLALGIMSRVAPQFSVFSIGFPVTIGAGLLLMLFAVPLLDAPISQALTLLGRMTRI